MKHLAVQGGATPLHEEVKTFWRGAWAGLETVSNISNAAPCEHSHPTSMLSLKETGERSERADAHLASLVFFPFAWTHSWLLPLCSGKVQISQRRLRHRELPKCREH